MLPPTVQLAWVFLFDTTNSGQHGSPLSWFCSGIGRIASIPKSESSKKCPSSPAVKVLERVTVAGLSQMSARVGLPPASLHGTK